MAQPRRQQQQRRRDDGNTTQPTQSGSSAANDSSSGDGAAARAILDELVDVLHEASARGIGLAASFAHFDRRQEGLVGVDEFMAAIVELRIGSVARLWGEDDAERCIESISAGKSRVYFSRADFVQFFAARVRGRADSAGSSTHSEARHSQQSVESRKAKSSALKLTKPSKKKQRVGGNNSNHNSDSPICDYLDEYHAQRVHASLNSRASVGVGVTAVAAKTKSKQSLVGLPAWAHDRSKRALKELENLQRRRTRLPPPSLTAHLYGDYDEHDDSQLCDDSNGNLSAAATQPPTGVSKLALPEQTESEVLEVPADSSKWRAFELDSDTTLSYAILTHDSVATIDADAAPHASPPPSSPPKLKVLAADINAHDTSAPSVTAFRFTVFLDAFQRLETLEAFFRPLLLQFPRGRILLCGFPTRTPRRTLWTNDCFAQAYGKLLVHLMHTTREWLVQPKLGIAAVPQFVVAFGSGGSTALRLLTTEIPLRAQSAPLLQLFLRAQRGLVLVNALAHTTDSARRALQQLKRVLRSGGGAGTSRVELHEALVQRVFSDFYLTQVAPSRRAATETFFHTRTRFLDGANLDLLQRMLHGSVKSKSVLPSLGNLCALESPFALVVVHGSQNALFGPEQVECLTNAFQPECVAPSLAACLAAHDPANVTSGASATPQLHVSWLKSGHEVLQERSHFMHGLFHELASVNVMLPVVHAADDAVQLTRSSDEHGMSSDHFQQSPSDNTLRDVSRSRTSVRELSAQPQSGTDSQISDGNPAVTATESAALTDISSQVRALLQQHGIKWIQQELYDRGLEGAGATAAILAQYERVLQDESACAREADLRAAQQRAKSEALDAQRREAQREALERQLREKEALMHIQQREHEAQRTFFAQMEAHKMLQTRLALEHELMMLEDARSLRCEELFRQTHARERRNSEMARQVDELDAERLEVEREQFQIALQRERLAAQQATRDQLKAFQRAFEQNELVSSPMEAYRLDLAPRRNNFGALADGAHVLAADLVHFYELKAAQKDESAEKRAELDASKAATAAQELALRNLERVLAKAKATGMIAKAGLGTVRIVPITTQEFQALTRELDEKHDALARMQHDLALRAQEVAWKDTLLQRLSELIKRNEGFRVEMLAKLALCAESGNELVLRAREDGETLFEQRERCAAVAKRCTIRLRGVQDERARAGACSTEYFDSQLRVEGTTQRMMRTVLLREHDTEIQVLEAKLQETQTLEAELKRKMKTNAQALSELGAETFNVEQGLKTLERATAAKDAPASGVSNGMKAGANPSSSSDVDANGVLRVRSELADEVRRKPHASRSAEEKRWVTLDFQLHFAHYYKTVAADEVEIIEKHGDYQRLPRPGASTSCSTSDGSEQGNGGSDARALRKDQIERILALPARNCLALAFFKDKAELEAHYLLRKYSFGDGEDYFASLDAAVAVADVLTDAVVTSKLDELPGAVDTASARGRRAGWFVDRGSYALLNENAAPVSLLSVPQCELQPHRSATHTFRLPTLGVGVLSLAVSIVFQGHFRSVGYQNGRLAGMLYVLPPPPVPTSLPSSAQGDDAPPPPPVRAPVPVGQCFFEHDIALCTPHSLGKLVIRHDPRAKPLCTAATYQVIVGAPVFTAYSIEVTARTALFASEVLKRKRSDALRKQELLPLKRDAIANVFVTLELSERKKRLARTLAHAAKDAARAAELEMIRQTKQLEADNVASLLSHDERAQLHSAIQRVETTFTHECFLFAKREEEARDIEAALKDLTRVHADLLDECAAMERDLAEYRAHLPQLAASLVESQDPRDRDAAGAKVARELNAEYESGKSGKVLWAELSAMKAKLPSMMTPAERLRRKYKKGQDTLEKKEREWILLDRILYPRLYDWEARLVTPTGGGGDARMRLHGACPKLSKDEEQLAVLSHMEVDRIMKAPWNLLERREIQVRKIVTKFRDDSSSGSGGSKRGVAQRPATMVALLRAQKTADLTMEEREWRAYDQILHPSYYPVNLKKLAGELRAASATPGGAAAAEVIAISPNLTREDLVAALNTSEDELFKLASEHLRARTLLLKFDPQLSVNLIEAARIQHSAATAAAMPGVDVVETDVDARCRLVYHELQRAIANTRNEFMDSCVLHSTLQRFPTKVLRLELEKELDRLLVAQVQEREQFELRTFLANASGDAHRTRAALALGATAQRKKARHDTTLGDSDSVSSSDSDDEAQIAREARATRQLKLDAKAGKHAKVLGKTLKQKSVQQQRREIKDALKGRSLEERRLLLQEQELGAGGCMACRTNPCVWAPYLKESYVSVERRMEALQVELERVKRCTDLTIESSVCLAAVKAGSGAIMMRKADLFDEVTSELKTWGKHLRLKAVDAEFHATFSSKEPFFETRALHGFAQTQQRAKVQVALQREHNVLVAHLTAFEVVDDILESMLEGWVFGERESERKALGFVPSIKRDGPLTMHDLRVLEQSERVLADQRELQAEERVQGVPLDKWQPIQVQAFAVNTHTKAVKQGSDVDKALTETENALKFGLFCMTLMYFRGLSMLKTQRRVWAAPTAVVGRAAEGSTPHKHRHQHQQTHASPERQRMDLEARNVARRQQRAAVVDAKAQSAQARKLKFLEQKTAAYRQRLVLENQRAKREAHAALEIQRVYRGHLGQIAGRKWMLRRREIDAQRALEHAAATMLQRAYRGRLGRLRAEETRVELAEFIAQMRAEEAINEEEEYWRRHRLERAARRVAAFVKREA